MNKVLYIILISLFSLTIISCSSDSSSDSGSSTTPTTSDDNTTTTTTTPNTCPAENWWQLMEGSTSRNVSLFGNPTLSRHSEQSSGKVLYVDQSALSQYPKRENRNKTVLKQFNFLFFHLRTPQLPTVLPVYTKSIKALTTGKLLV